MLQCMCRGEFKPIIVNKIITVLGIQQVTVRDLKVYRCDGCGKEIFPKETISKLKDIQQKYYCQPADEMGQAFL